MESRKYCAYNKTQASFLSLGITVVDTVNEPFKGQIEDLARNAPAGLWLNPCRELPVGLGLVDFDVVYLDEDFQVVEVVESSPDLAFEPPKTLAASALALPSHTIASSQTQCGDELIIWAAEGTGRKSAQSSKSVTQALKRLVPSPAENDSAKPQAASGQLDDGEKPSFMTRLKVWTAAKRAHRVADIPLSTAPAPTIAAPIAPALVASPPAIPAASTPAPVKPVPAVPVQVVPDPITAAPVISAPVLPSAVTPAPVKPAEVAPVRVVPSPTAPAPVISAPITPPPVRPAVVSQSIESVVAKQDVAQAGFTLSPAGDDTAKPPAAIEPLEVKQQAEPGPQYRPSLMSRYKTWVAEKAAHPAADASISIAPARTAPIPVVPTPIAPAPAVPAAAAPAPAKAAPVTQSGEFLIAKPAAVQTGFTLSPARRDTAKPPAAIEPSEVKRKAESEPQHRPSLISRYETWAAERAVLLAADIPISIAPAKTTPAPADAAPAVPVRVAAAPIAPPAPVVPAPITPTAIDAAPVKPTPVTPVPVDQTPAKPSPFIPSSETLFAKKPRAERHSGQSPAGHVTAKPQAVVKPSDDKKDAESTSVEKPSLKIRILRWLNNPRPAAQRHSKPGLVAYYWTGGPPQAHEVVNISATGLYVRTREHWLPDTVILMTLQRIGSSPDNPEDSVSVLSKVIRQDEDGVGLEFVTSESAGLTGSQFVPGKGKDKIALQRFMRRMKSKD
jgi:hypothetical protein